MNDFELLPYIKNTFERNIYFSQRCFLSSRYPFNAKVYLIGLIKAIARSVSNALVTILIRIKPIVVSIEPIIYLENSNRSQMCSIRIPFRSFKGLTALIGAWKDPVKALSMPIEAFLESIRTSVGTIIVSTYSG